MKTFELSQKIYQDGVRNFKVVLLKIFPDSCVVNDIGTEFNDNGITWIEEYVEANKDTIIGRSITCEFIDEDRTEIYSHGESGIVEDGIPTFPNATMIGTFTKSYIDTINIDGVETKCLIGEGTIDAFRYKNFCDKVDERLENGEVIYGSVEIFKKVGSDGIVYKNDYTGEGRIPMEFIFSGFALLGVQPADKNAIVLELNEKRKNKEDNFMEEKDFKEMINNMISEINSKKETESITNLNKVITEKDTKINELNACIEEKNACGEKKDTEINALNVKIQDLEKALADLKAERDTMWEQQSILEDAIAQYKVAERVAKFAEATATFTEEEKAYATNEINEFNAKTAEDIKGLKDEDIVSEINSIVTKINAEIGVNYKKVVAEQNAKKAEEKIQNEINSKNNTNDIYGSMDTLTLNSTSCKDEIIY